MPPVSLAIRKPGVDTISTALESEGGLSDSNLIRFLNGKVQKLGGCTRMTEELFVGTCRELFAWASLIGDAYLAVGTSERLQLLSQGSLTDITPIDSTSNLTTPFSTTASSSTVTITDAGASPIIGNWIQIVNATYIGGLLLQGYYQVTATAYPDYDIDAGSNATGTVAGGGDVAEYTTTLGDDVVVITIGAYAFFQDETFTAGVSTTVGGLIIFGDYPIDVAGGPVYSFTGPNLATSNDVQQENGGQTRINYLLTLPSEDPATGAYGTGPYGRGPYGTGAATDVANIVAWSFDNWGENLIAAFAGDTIYEWTPPVAIGNVALPISGAPESVNGIVTANPYQQIIAWGAYSATLGQQDPMLIRWCDVADNTEWVAATDNQAGSFRLPTGSVVVRVLWIGINGLIWTDEAMWTMTYVGFPLVYGFTRTAPNAGLYAPRALASVGTRIFWMADKGEFFIFEGGGVRAVTCTVRNFIYDNIDENYAQATFCWADTFNYEVYTFFATAGSGGVCNAYVKLNMKDRGPNGEPLWDKGMADEFQRSAAIDHSVMGAPIAADYNQLLQQSDTSNNFDDEAGDSWFLTGFFKIAEGQEFVYLDTIWPDFTINDGGEVLVTVYVYEDMNANPLTYGPYTITSATEYFYVGASGRLLQIKVQSTEINTFWRYGAPIANVQPFGRRGGGSVG